MSEKDPDAAPEAASEPKTTEEREAGPKEEPRENTGRAALGLLLGALVRRGKTELERAASQTRVRLDLRQLRRDREAMYAKVGRETRSLLEGGEIRHPGLERSVSRIAEIEKKIAEVEAEMAGAGLAVEPDETR